MTTVRPVHGDGEPQRRALGPCDLLDVTSDEPIASVESFEVAMRALLTAAKSLEHRIVAIASIDNRLVVLLEPDSKGSTDAQRA